MWFYYLNVPSCPFFENRAHVLQTIPGVNCEFYDSIFYNENVHSFIIKEDALNDYLMLFPCQIKKIVVYS